MHTIKAQSAGFSAERLGRIRPALQRYIDDGRIPGMATLIARHGRVIHCEAYGLMDLEAERPMTTDGIVRIYSMSKPITSVAAMMLHEEGRFLLSEPVSAFLPEFADVEVYAGEGPDGPRTVPLERPITMHHLFTHTAGLAYGLDRSTPVDAMYQDVNARRRRPPTLATWIHDLAEMPLIFQPGTVWKYSMATDVLGRVVEVISGQSLDAYFRERIFEPLGMDDTGFSVAKGQADRLCTMYAVGDEGLVRASGPQPNDYLRKPVLLSGGGGLVSTAHDYWRFAQMLLNGGSLEGVRLLGPRTVAFMTRNHLRADLLPFGDREAPGAGFGLGFEVILDPALARCLGSAGSFSWSGLAGTDFWVDPQEDLVAIIMPQVLACPYPIGPLFRTLVYQALDC